MQQGKELRLFNNGHSSQTIFVSNGLAQGDALSPFIFIVCMEALAQVVRVNPIIQGFEFENIQKKIGLVADDTLMSVKANPLL